MRAKLGNAVYWVFTVATLLFILLGIFSTVRHDRLDGLLGTAWVAAAIYLIGLTARRVITGRRQDAALPLSRE